MLSVQPSQGPRQHTHARSGPHTYAAVVSQSKKGQRILQIKISVPLVVRDDKCLPELQWEMFTSVLLILLRDAAECFFSRISETLRPHTERPFGIMSAGSELLVHATCLQTDEHSKTTQLRCLKETNITMNTALFTAADVLHLQFSLIDFLQQCLRGVQ